MVTVSLQALPFRSSHYSPFPLEKHSTGLTLACRLCLQNPASGLAVFLSHRGGKDRDPTATEVWGTGKKNTLQSPLLPSQKNETGA